MSFSFKYKPIILKGGSLMYRPMIPLTLKGNESIDIIGILDSGSDMSIIPKTIADLLGIHLLEDNEVFGIGGIPIKTKQGKARVAFGKGREFYEFEIPVLVPLDKEDVAIIIGRFGFFNQFKITFDESSKKVEFKKMSI